MNIDPNIKINQRVLYLINKGVVISTPLSIDIGDDVDLDRISGEGTVLYSGCRIYGKKTLIMKGTKLGYEAPVTIKDCQIGQNVELKGGYFQNSVFLRKSNMGSCAQVRDACILEEEANGAHLNGLKHTILFPFVTLGSVINFCDCLMSGGTSRKNHSEVGSSYIHFNYTPNQDKATASLIGDVPKGVMLDQKPIFLGGQGGLVGPAKLGFGTVIAAGGVFRGNSLEDNRIIVAKTLKEKNSDFHPGLYRNIKSSVLNNINYCANLIALRCWYLDIRSQFFQRSSMGSELYIGALEKLDLAINERIKRFKALVEKLPQSAKIYQYTMKENASIRLINQKNEIAKKWQEIENIFYHFRDIEVNPSEKSFFIENISKEIDEKGEDYIKTIQGLDKKTRSMGTKWLSNIVDEINKRVLDTIPSFVK